MSHIAESLASTPDQAVTVSVHHVPAGTVDTLPVAPSAASVHVAALAPDSAAAPAPASPASAALFTATPAAEHLVTVAGHVIALQSLALSTPESTEETKSKKAPRKKRQARKAKATTAQETAAIPSASRASSAIANTMGSDQTMAEVASASEVAAASVVALAVPTESTPEPDSLAALAPVTAASEVALAGTASEVASEVEATTGATAAEAATEATDIPDRAQQLLWALRASEAQESNATPEVAATAVMVKAEEPLEMPAAMETIGSEVSEGLIEQPTAEASAQSAVMPRATTNASAAMAGKATMGTNASTGTGISTGASVSTGAELTAEEQARYSGMELKEGDRCPHCGQGTLLIRHTEHVDFLGCTCFPSCKIKVFLHRLNQVTTMQVLKSTCSQCGKPLAVKKGRYGLFIGCSNYPECTYVYKEQEEGLPSIVCPQCHKGQLEPRRAHSGRIFFGCNAYPKCKFILPGKPVLSPCPECGFSLRFQKKVKAGIAIMCGNPLCASRRKRKHEMLPAK